MLFGYARVSTKDQNPDLQTDALKKAGCVEIFVDFASGAKTERPELNKLLSKLREGDIIIIWKLDRLGRSLKHLVEMVTEFLEKGIDLKCLDSPIDTTTPQGRLIFNIFASLAEFERDLIRERTNAGLDAARARGRKGGRPKGLSPESINKSFAVETLYKEEELTVKQICEQLNISKRTLYNLLRYRGVAVGK